MQGHYFWILPIVAGRPLYPSMEPGQSIAYISDIGAGRLKPLFVTCAALTTVSFNASTMAETWLRHWVGLEHNFTQAEKRLSIVSILFGILGGQALLYLSIFDTQDYPRVHNACLFTFMGAFVASAICNCWEHGSLASRGQEYHAFRDTFHMKLAFILLELGLATAFMATWSTQYYNAAAVMEWNLATVFGIHLFTYAIDLFPARHNSAQCYESKPDDI
ncbi:FK506 suppressor Sfk1 [Diplocarpon mali]|nr:FK506 suppressor Sfk1 [Diplocarpon mali]